MKVVRALILIAANGVSYFVLVVGSIIVLILASGGDPRDGGMLMISPMTMIILGMVPAAATHGVVYGIATALLWDWFRLPAGGIKLSLILAAVGNVLLWGFYAIVISLEEPAKLILWAAASTLFSALANYVSIKIAARAA